MVVFAIATGRYNVYADNILVGYLVPTKKGAYGSDVLYEVSRIDRERNEIPNGRMLMSEARRLFEAIYG